MSTFLQQCKDFVKDNGISGSGPSTVVGQTGVFGDVVYWVDRANRAIQSLHNNWGFLEEDLVITLSDDTGDYSLSDMGLTDLGTWKEDSFIINPGTANKKVLKKYDFDKWITSDERAGTYTTQEPENFIIKRPDKALAFKPIPNGTFTVWAKYYKKPVAMTANTDESVIPSQFHDIILYRATMFYARHMGFPSKIYESANEDYKALLSSLESHSLPDSQMRHNIGASWENDRIETV